MFLEFLTADGAVVPFPSLKFRVGSAPSCEVRFDGLEPQHLEIWSENGGNNWRGRALCTSPEGLHVNGAPARETRVSPGVRLGLNAVALEVRLTRATPSGVIDSLGETNVRSPFLESGTIIDQRYEILERIASGGMGQVYRAVHVELRKPLAVKVMLPSLSENQDFVARFKREAIAVSRIGHENIVDVSDFGRTADGRFFFVMELVDGNTLGRHLRSDGPFSPQRVIRVGKQVARALAAAHAAGVVHRDLKPENIMLIQRPGQPDFVKVLDFGVAKVQASGTTAFGGQTAVGMVVGTPQYMPPEQARGLTIDGRTDVYTLGLILHELLMGRPCFRGDSTASLLWMQLNSEPPPLALVGMPPGLEALVLQMLRKAPADRPASMAEVLERLDQLAVDNGTPRTPLPMAIDPAAASTVRIQAPPETRLAPLTPLELNVEAGPPTEAPGTALMSAPTEAVPAVRPVVVRRPHVPAAPKAVTSEESALLEVPRSRTPAVVVGLLAVLVVGVGGWYAWSSAETRGGSFTTVDAGVAQVLETPVEPKPVAPPAPSPPTPPPAPTAQPARGRMAIGTAPMGAEVYEGDVFLGTTPLTLQRAIDSVAHLRFVLTGYEDVTRKVGFGADSTLTVTLVKSAAPAKPATKPPAPKPPPPPSELKEVPF